MMEELIAIMNKYGQQGVELIVSVIQPLRATGKTQASVRYEIQEEDGRISLRFIGRGFTSLLEKGRRPTSKGPSPEMIQNLEEYARARGMDNPKQAAWALAKTLNKKGNKTLRMGGRELYSQALQVMIDKMIKELIEKNIDIAIGEIKRAIQKAA